MGVPFRMLQFFVLIWYGQGPWRSHTHTFSRLSPSLSSSSSFALQSYVFRPIGFRKDTRTHVAKNHTHAAASRRETVHMWTWNILAAQYALCHKYPWTDPAFLDWSSYRQERIVDMIRNSQADIVCLQEVPVNVWNSDIRQPLQDIYSIAILQNVTRQHPVACAILLRRDFPWQIIRTESRSRALFIVLEKDNRDDVEERNPLRHVATRPQVRTRDAKDGTINPQQRLYEACVHLEAGGGADKEDTRWNQLRSLLKRIHQHMMDLGDDKDDDEQKLSLILAGDFNMYTSSNQQLYHLLSTGCTASKIDDKTATATGPSSLSSRRERTGDIPLRLSRSANAVAPRAGSSSVSSSPWMSLLPLRDAHAQSSSHDRSVRRGPPHVTFAGGAVLDYIWVSRNLQVLQSIAPPVQEELIVVTDNVTQMDWSAPQPQTWPNRELPSDHIPISARILLP